MKLKGIMEYSLGGFLTFRGFANFKDIVRISKADENYQRDIIKEHSKNLQEFLGKGENLFFPEVVLGCYLPESNDEILRSEEFYTSFRKDKNGNFGFRKLNIRIQAPKPYGDNSFKVATLSTLRQKSDENIFFRIDGNHRITALEEIKDNRFDNPMLALCIIFFRNEEEYKRQSKIIFHNLNFKMLPLSMEQNLKLIFEDKENFPDEILKNDSSFGYEYYLAREFENKLNNYSNIAKIIGGEPKTTLLHLFKTLKETECIDIKKTNECIDTVKKAFEDINANTIYKDKELLKTPNPIIFSTFIYYYLCEDNETIRDKKIELFKKWILNNHIYKAKKLKLESLIEIFDEIYRSRIKKIFVAMAFGEQNCNNVWDSIVDVYDELVNDGYELDKSHRDESGKYMPYRVDKPDAVSKNIIEKIKKEISACDLMLADLTYNRQNVYYEIGLAEGQNKPMIIIKDKDKEDKVHFDLLTMDRFEYDSNNLGDFKKELKRRLQNLLEKCIYDKIN